MMANSDRGQDLSLASTVAWDQPEMWYFCNIFFLFYWGGRGDKSSISPPVSAAAVDDDNDGRAGTS